MSSPLSLLKEIAAAVWRAVVEVIRRDRAAKKAEPREAASPLLVIPIPPRRTYIAMGCISLGFLALAGRALWLQLFSSDFLKGQGEARYARTLTIAGVRGEILDRNGVVLASSQPVRSIWADPAFAKKATRSELEALAKVLEVPYATIRDKIRKNEQKNFVYLARQKDVTTAEAVRALAIPGIGITPEVLREYPDGPVMAHVVGYTGWNDRGQEGVELSCDKLLAGAPGARRVIRDRLGRIVDDVWAKEAVPGRDVTLSIDSRVQFIAYKALGEQMEKVKRSLAPWSLPTSKRAKSLRLRTRPRTTRTIARRWSSSVRATASSPTSLSPDRP